MNNILIPLSMVKKGYLSFCKSRLQYGNEYWCGTYFERLNPSVLHQINIGRIIRNKIEYSFPLFKELNVLPYDLFMFSKY